ncbi:hypothetical protein ACUTAH_14295 [Metapseudomonas furukawaii]|uniref:hypothetical protein n=1 Tax=Metapseudomonas furukawaii TaxID=1149133 RepID=UPI00404538D1
MRDFVEHVMGVDYFFVLDRRDSVLPFGICGPFAKRREAKKAASKLRARFPGRQLIVCDAFFARPFKPESLVKERRKARANLKAMLGA